MSVSLFHDNFYAMGTRFEVLFWGISSATARPVYNEIYNEVTWLEAALSHYDEQSPISAINRNAGVKPVVVPSRVLSVLGRCRHHWEQTEGLFNVIAPSSTIGERLSADRENHSVLTLSDDASTAFLGEKEVEIDLGGVGKGLALERVEDILDTHTIENALVSFGESSILTRGRHPHGDVWKLGISHISDRETSLCSFDLGDDALSTSGNTPRNEGTVRHPRTGRPKRDYETVSVRTSSPVEAEVLSTALLLANPEEERRILSTYDPVRAVRISYDQQATHPDLTELTHPALT